jgi:hypothetical protein
MGGKCIEYFGLKTRREETTRKPRRRWEDNIKTDLRETVWECVDWIYMAHDRDLWQALVNTVMTFGSHKRRRIS